jgi:hypothetical protein
LKNIIAGPYGPLSSANTDAEILSYARSNGNSLLHPVGTAAMSPVGANWGVVDPDLKVKGAYGIRVVDGSVWVSTHLIVGRVLDRLLFCYRLTSPVHILKALFISWLSELLISSKRRDVSEMLVKVT